MTVPPWEGLDFHDTTACAQTFRMSVGHRAALKYIAGVRGISSNALLLELIEECAARSKPAQPSAAAVTAIEKGMAALQEARALLK